MLDKMKQLMDMKRQAEQLKKELDAMTTEACDTSGIKIVISGAQEFRSLDIEEGLLNPANKKRLEEDLLKSINSAIRKSQQLAASKMKDAMLGF